MKTKTNEAVVRFEAEPGEQMQVDFTVIRRGRDPLLAFVATLGWSAMSFSPVAKTPPHGVPGLKWRYVSSAVRRENCSSITKTIIQERDVYGPGERRWNSALLSLILELAGLPFIERKENVVLQGPSGVGKTHLASALAHRVIMAGISTRFISAANLTLQLVAAHHQGRLAQYFSHVVQRAKLLAIDEIGYLPFGRDEANLFFNVIVKRYEHGSVVLTNNLPFSQ